MVWPQEIGSAWSAYAKAAWSASTNRSRGTSSMALRTAALLIPRRRRLSWNSMPPTLFSAGGCLATPCSFFPSLAWCRRFEGPKAADASLGSGTPVHCDGNVCSLERFSSRERYLHDRLDTVAEAAADAYGGRSAHSSGNASG